jgi:putative nucleotidyltransferase with HDIG domain
MNLATGTSKATTSSELQWDPDSLPPFPAIALKALNLLSGTDGSLPSLCNLIRSDPAFSAAVLKIANSPLVAFSGNITSVLQASMLLGFKRLRIVVITVGLKAYLKDSFTPLMRSCWHHSLACAIIAEQGAKWMQLDNDFAYTAGILHDIGRVALATLVPGSYASVVKRGADQPRDILQIERELCGIDHCQAGRSLVTSWNLPEAFLEITGCHHDHNAILPVAEATPRFSPIFQSQRENAFPTRPKNWRRRSQVRLKSLSRLSRKQSAGKSRRSEGNYSQRSSSWSGSSIMNPPASSANSRSR